MTDTYDDDPAWSRLFDSLKPIDGYARDRDKANLATMHKDAVKALQELEYDLQTDEDGDTERQALKNLKTAATEVEGVLSDTFDMLNDTEATAKFALDEVEHHREVIIDLFKFCDAVMVSDHHEEVLAWARGNLNGDWDCFTYKQTDYRPERTKYIFVMKNDVDRVNFKMRWA